MKEDDIAAKLVLIKVFFITSAQFPQAVQDRLNYINNYSVNHPVAIEQLRKFNADIAEYLATIDQDNSGSQQLGAEKFWEFVNLLKKTNSKNIVNLVEYLKNNSTLCDIFSLHIDSLIMIYERANNSSAKKIEIPKLNQQYQLQQQKIQVTEEKKLQRKFKQVILVLEQIGAYARTTDYHSGFFDDFVCRLHQRPEYQLLDAKTSRDRNIALIKYQHKLSQLKLLIDHVAGFFSEADKIAPTQFNKHIRIILSEIPDSKYSDIPLGDFFVKYIDDLMEVINIQQQTLRHSLFVVYENVETTIENIARAMNNRSANSNPSNILGETQQKLQDLKDRVHKKYKLRVLDISSADIKNFTAELAQITLLHDENIKSLQATFVRLIELVENAFEKRLSFFTQINAANHSKCEKLAVLHAALIAMLPVQLQSMVKRSPNRLSTIRQNIYTMDVYFSAAELAAKAEEFNTIMRAEANSNYQQKAHVTGRIKGMFTQPKPVVNKVDETTNDITTTFSEIGFDVGRSNK